MDDFMDDLLNNVTACFDTTYIMLSELGRGDMGKIDLVKEATLQRKVAIKSLNENNDYEGTRRFLIEAQITAQLEHPHIVPIYTLENTPTGLAYTMKRIVAKDFNAWMSSCDSLVERLESFLAVCDALDYAHHQQVVHRELQPDTIFFGNNHDIYVMNWGSARLLPEASLEVVLPSEYHGELSVQAPLAANPAYFSPEQAAGAWDELDARSDIYVLGLMLYEASCLSHAKTLDNSVDFAQLSRLPVDLQAIIQRATAKHTEKRYQKVSDLRADVQHFLRGESVSARRDSLFQATSRWLTHHQLFAITGAVVVVLFTASLGLWSLWTQQQVLETARQREVVINQFLSAVYSQSRLMNRQFLKAESQLESLTSVAISHFSQQTPAREPYFLHEKFSPPDSVKSTQFHSQISVNWPMSVKTYSIPEAKVSDTLQELSPLRYFMQRLLVQSQTHSPLSAAQKERLIATTGTPVSYATVMRKEGVGLWLPGGEFDAPKYDPMKRPFYLFGAKQHKRRWGNPYIDVSGAGLLLTAATGLFDYDQNYLGTASIDMKFDTIIQTMLDLPPALRHLKGSYLLDDKGNIAIRSNQQGQEFEAKIHPNLQLPAYPRPEVVSQVKQKKSGHFISSGENPVLVAYYRISALGWYYVVETELNPLLRKPSSQRF